MHPLRKPVAVKPFRKFKATLLCIRLCHLCGKAQGVFMRQFEIVRLRKGNIPIVGAPPRAVSLYQFKGQRSCKRRILQPLCDPCPIGDPVIG